MEYAIKLSHLSKSFGSFKAVDDVSLEIKPRHIYGLIGPNGAGKTTIMKMIAGICAQSSGEIGLFGSTENIDDSRKRMSFMIEAPYIDGNMNARQNLEYIRRLRGVADVNRIDAMLKYTGLNNTDGKKVKKFSLGMKQRLGIAMALLPNPEIMILDEPVNGLDPEGIVEVRHMLKRLCDEEGITILISSHLLAELYELCTDFTIIDKGCLVENVSREELDRKCRSYIAVEAGKPEELAAVLEQKAGINEYKVMENGELHIYERLDDIESISADITGSGLIIRKLNIEAESLEKYYLSRVTSSGEEANASRNKGLFGRRSR